MAEKKYNILKAASWYTVGNILIKGVSFFVLPVFTRLMSTHEYGIYSIYTSYLMIFETVILLGLSSTVALARYAKEVDFDSYISTIIAIPSVLTLACMLVANVAIPMFGDILSMDATLWNCLFISAGAGAICNILGAKLIIEGRYKLYMASSAMQTFSNVGISLLLVYTFYQQQNAHLARVYGSTTSIIIGVLFLILATKTRFSVKKINVKCALMWGIPLLFHTVATVALQQSDRIIIRYMDSYSSAGIYAVATTIVSIPLMLQQSLGQAYAPWFYGKLEAKDYKKIRWFNDRYIVLYGVIIAGFMLLAPDVIHLFTERSYWPCLYSLIPLAIGGFGEMLYSIPTGIEIFNKKTTYLMYATLTAVVFNITLDIVFIRVFGYHGAAYATAISKLILFLVHYFFARKIDNNKVFSNGVVVLNAVALIMLNFFVIQTMDYLIIRYLILGIIMIITGCYVMKNKDLLLYKLREK